MAVGAHNDQVYVIFLGIISNLLVGSAFAYCCNYIGTSALEFGSHRFRVFFGPSKLAVNKLTRLVYL